MEGLPMEVCIALGLLSEEQAHQIHMIKGETLQAKLSFVRRMD
jgi:hypothetical protein